MRSFISSVGKKPCCSWQASFSSSSSRRLVRNRGAGRRNDARLALSARVVCLGSRVHAPAVEDSDGQEPRAGGCRDGFPLGTKRIRPGKIVIEGQRYEATSEREFIAHGSRVRVIGKDGPALVVRPEEDA
ncbi:MAG: hypothetical protein JRH14_21660 [Deltaproteobacteria bacterium]|nr:hypothetical protein [Deltaproteobacteria bacterium]